MDKEGGGAKPPGKITVRKRKKGRPLPCDRMCETCVKPCENPANPEASERNTLKKMIH